MTAPGLIISAPASGTGKTTLMLGLLGAFRAEGLAVQPFKCGPDYIDPAFHCAASGRKSYNLDSWAMGADRIARLIRAAEGADLAVAEGSMGLFDGVARPGETGTGASADISAMTGWPVVLILDVSGQAQSAAAVAKGFTQMRPDVALAGVILNRVASPRHEVLVRAGMEAVGIPVLGALPRRASIEMPERHLGLVQADPATGADHRRSHRICRGSRRSGGPSPCRRGHAGRCRGAAHAGNAARPAYRPGARCGIFIRLSASSGWLARGRGRDFAVFATGG